MDIPEYTDSPLAHERARIVPKVPKSANFEFGWGEYKFYTWKGEFVAVADKGTR